MKCLTKNQIQLLLDGEYEQKEAKQYVHHLTECSRCLEKYTTQEKDILKIKHHINLLAQNPEVIPGFNYPLMKSISKSGYSKKAFFPMILKIAAVLLPACIMIGIFLKADNPYVPTKEDIQYYDLCNSIDANSTLQENTLISIITDENGNIITYEIN